MNVLEKQRLIDLISCGHILASVKTIDNKIIKLILSSPTAMIKAAGSLVYQEAYDESIAAGILPEDQEIQTYIQINKWNPQTDIEIEGLKKDIYNIRRGLLDLFFNKEKLNKARQMLRQAEMALIERLTTKYELLKTSAESCAMISQQRYIIGQIAQTLDGQKYWADNDIFNDEIDIELINQLVYIFFNKSIATTRQIREIARSSPWKEFWSSSKNICNLFNLSPVEWSNLQKDLVYWSYVYDMVNDAYERPMREIIEDDDLLDSWFIRQGEQIEERAKKDSVEIPGNKSNKPGRQEHFIVTDKEGAKAVYALNDRTGRAKVQTKQKIISKQGIIKEQDLPESQMEMRELAVSMQSKKVKSISKK